MAISQYRLVPWGRALQVTTINAPGGLKAAHKRILQKTGNIFGRSAQTYSALYELDNGPAPDTKAYERAALLLWSLGENIEEWEMSMEHIPNYLRSLADPSVWVESGDGSVTAAYPFGCPDLRQHSLFRPILFTEREETFPLPTASRIDNGSGRNMGERTCAV